MYLSSRRRRRRRRLRGRVSVVNPRHDWPAVERHGLPNGVGLSRQGLLEAPMESDADIAAVAATSATVSGCRGIAGCLQVPETEVEWRRLSAFAGFRCLGLLGWTNPRRRTSSRPKRARPSSRSRGRHPVVGRQRADPQTVELAATYRYATRICTTQRAVSGCIWTA